MAKQKLKEKRMPTIHAQADDSPVATVKETAKLLKISESLLWQMIRRKKLIPIRLGDRVLFSRRYLQRFCDGE
jgi:excisionase family DNA binding protein